MIAESYINKDINSLLIVMNKGSTTLSYDTRFSAMYIDILFEYIASAESKNDERYNYDYNMFRTIFVKFTGVRSNISESKIIKEIEKIKYM